MSVAPRVVLLHATPIAIASIQSAFTKHCLDAETVNLPLDQLLGQHQGSVAVVGAGAAPR
jgi:hypothetical protein